MAKEKDNVKHCMICTLLITLDKDNYLILKEHCGKKLVAETYYHSDCFRQKFLVQQQIKDMASSMKNMMTGMLGKS